MNTSKIFLARTLTVLTVTVAALSPMLVATPALANYGANESYSLGDQVCSSRYDPYCIIKETNYLNENAPRSYGNYQNQNYHHQGYSSNYNQNYSQNYYPQYSYTPSYSYNSYNPYQYSYIAPSYNSYNYQYSYGYQYQYQNSNYPGYGYSY